ALAGLSLERGRPEAGGCVAAAIDVSASVGSAGRDTAREFLARLVPALGARDALGALAFAGRTRVLAYPAAGRAGLDALVPGGDVDDLEPDETDLAAALARATALCPDDRRAALLLFTDGNESEGSLLAEAALAEPRVPIYPVVPPPARLPPAAIRRLIVPPLAPAPAAPRAGGERAGAAGGGACAREARHGGRGDGARRPRRPRRTPRGLSRRRPRGRGPCRHPGARARRARPLGRRGRRADRHRRRASLRRRRLRGHRPRARAPRRASARAPRADGARADRPLSPDRPLEQHGLRERSEPPVRRQDGV